MKRRIIQWLVPLLILGIALFTAKKMAQRKGSVGAKKRPVVQQRVEAYNPVAWNQAFVIRALGKTVPARELTLQAQVSGLVTKLHPEMVPGGRVKAGDTLVEIEKSDYLLKIKQAQSQVQQARVRVQEEQGRQTIAEKEWSLLSRAKSTNNSRGRALALREPQLKSARAGLKAAQSVLAAAKLALERTTIKSPMNAVLVRENVEVGQRVAPGAGIVSMAGTDLWWVQASVSHELLAQLEANEVTVTVHGSNDPAGLNARIVRRLADLDAASKMVRLVVEVDDPLRLDSKGSPLYLGDTVELQFSCTPKVEDVLALPRQALRAGNKIWTISSEGVLQIQDIQVFWKGNELLLVQGLTTDTIVVTSNLTMPTAGSALKWDTPKRLSQESKTASNSPEKATP